MKCKSNDQLHSEKYKWSELHVLQLQKYLLKYMMLILSIVLFLWYIVFL